jgi:hypothetical protein
MNEEMIKGEVGLEVIEQLSERDILINKIREELDLEEGQELTTQMVSESGMELTPDEFSTLMGWKSIPKFPKRPKFFTLRKMFKQLTKTEARDAQKDADKAAKLDRGMVKIFGLLARAGI